MSWRARWAPPAFRKGEPGCEREAIGRSRTDTADVACPSPAVGPRSRDATYGNRSELQSSERSGRQAAEPEDCREAEEERKALRTRTRLTRETTELHPQMHNAARRWSASESNRSGLPCKGKLHPGGHPFSDGGDVGS